MAENAPAVLEVVGIYPERHLARRVSATMIEGAESYNSCETKPASAAPSGELEVVPQRQDSAHLACCT